jgi:predicted aldo/keto reductase-like oxidoreductase
VIQGALRFLLDDPRISVVLVGFGNEQHVEEAVAAAAPHEPLRTERREAIRARVASTFDRMCTGCGYCAPCPQGLDLPRLMQGYNQALFGNEPQVLSSLKYGYGADGEAVEACTRCGLCETRCTQKLPIPDRLEHIAGLKRKSTGC